MFHDPTAPHPLPVALGARPTEILRFPLSHRDSGARIGPHKPIADEAGLLAEGGQASLFNLANQILPRGRGQVYVPVGYGGAEIGHRSSLPSSDSFCWLGCAMRLRRPPPIIPAGLAGWGTYHRLQVARPRDRLSQRASRRQEKISQDEVPPVLPPTPTTKHGTRRHMADCDVRSGPRLRHPP